MISVIFVHYSNNDWKSELARFCFNRLLRTTPKDTEIIVVNNSDRDEEFFKERADVYLKTPRNSLGGARNLGYDHTKGEWIVFMDDDVFTMYHWLSECIRLLQINKDHKLIASPVYTDVHVFNSKFQAGKLRGHLLNWRSGSPCFVLRREDFEEIGRFKEGDGNSGDGGNFTDRQVRKGYKVILTKKQKAFHIGDKRNDY